MFRHKSTAAIAIRLSLVLGKTPVHEAQDKPDKGNSEDKPLFLGGRPELADLCFKYPMVAGEHQVAGLVVNRPARIVLNTIFFNPRARLRDAQESIA